MSGSWVLVEGDVSAGSLEAHGEFGPQELRVVVSRAGVEAGLLLRQVPSARNHGGGDVGQRAFELVRARTGVAGLELRVFGHGSEAKMRRTRIWGL